MAYLKSYTCTECGAVLSVDKLQGQFACPFCGAEFNSADFHRDELIRQADECLSRGAYDAAKEKYDAVLANNGQDLDAIRGQILIAGKIHSINDLNKSENLLRADLEAVDSLVDKYKDVLSEEDAGYISKLAGLFKKAINIREHKEKIEKTLAQERVIRKEQSRKAQAGDGCFSGCGTTLAFYAAGWLIVLLLGPFMLNNGIGGMVVGGLVLLVGTGIALILVNVLKKPEETKEVHYAALPESSGMLKDQLNKLEEEYDKDRSFVMHYGKPVRTGAKLQSAKKETVAPAADTEGAITCAKCGAVLKLSADRELYECAYCGVSYGTVLFLGDLLKNAKKSIGHDGFDEADQILAHKLKLNPKDSEALLGRFLCAGKWKTLSDIKLSDRALYFHIARLTERLEKLEKSISVEDQPDWPELKKLADLLKEYSVVRKEADKMDDKHKSLEGKIMDPTLTNMEKHKMLKEMSRLSTDVMDYDLERTRMFTLVAEQLKLLKEKFKGSAFV